MSDESLRRATLAASHENEQNDAAWAHRVRGMSPGEHRRLGDQFEAIKAELGGMSKELDALLDLGVCKYAELLERVILERTATDAA